MSCSMEAVPDLEASEAVSTEATNWEFVGSDEHPSWKNKETEHILLIDDAESAKYTYRIRLQHKDQCKPWWTLTEENDTNRVLRIIEWVLSAPESQLENREAASILPEKVWNEASN